VSPIFALGRDSWIKLFQGLQNGDGNEMTSALQQLEGLIQH
jgi:hypothetical protein